VVFPFQGRLSLLCNDQRETRILVLAFLRRAIQSALAVLGYTLVRVPVFAPTADQGTRELLFGAAEEPPQAILTDDSWLASSTRERFSEVEQLLRKVAPWSGQVREGYVANFLGVLTQGRFLWNKKGPFDGGYVTTTLPTVGSEGEGYFEIADWFYSAHDATDQYIAISLGAAYGAQLVGAWKTLQLINPLPSKLVAIEPVPENCAWIRQHMADNGIAPDEHSIIQAVVDVDNRPNLFPVGAAGTGLTASVDTNSERSRQIYADLFERKEYCGQVLRNIFLRNSTGVTRGLPYGYSAEIQFVSSVTLHNVLAPFDRVDLLEIDIQGAENTVIAPFMNMLNRKVRRVHLGTHGSAVHFALRKLFYGAGWESVFDYTPDAQHMTARGPFEIGDGILSVRNPRV